MGVRSLVCADSIRGILYVMLLLLVTVLLVATTAE